MCCSGFGVCTDLHRLPRSRPREPGPPMQPQHLKGSTDIGAIWRESHLIIIYISMYLSLSLSLTLSLPTWLAICHKRSSNLSALALGVSGTVTAESGHGSLGPTGPHWAPLGASGTHWTHWTHWPHWACISGRFFLLVRSNPLALQHGF